MGEKGKKLTNAAGTAAEQLQDSLASLGDIRLRKMFGGYGVFIEEKMFALVDSQGQLFFKADESNVGMFTAAGAEKHGRMPYYRLPEAVLAAPDDLLQWATSSITVARK